MYLMSIHCFRYVYLQVLIAIIRLKLKFKLHPRLSSIKLY